MSSAIDSGKRRADSLALRLLRSTRPVSLRVGASIGVALYPQHAMTAADMIRAGDAAMYEAKRSGTNQIRVAPPIALQASA